MNLEDQHTIPAIDWRSAPMDFDFGSKVTVSIHNYGKNEPINSLNPS